MLVKVQTTVMMSGIWRALLDLGICTVGHFLSTAYRLGCLHPCRKDNPEAHKISDEPAAQKAA